MKKIFTLLVVIALANMAFAGNPDRQGSAGAGELLMNPWARSAGLHTINTAGIIGIEATQLNIAGLARISKTEIAYSHAQYLVGTGIQMNAIGLGQKVGKNGVLGLDLMVLGFGDVKVTTVNQPEGTGAYYSPTWANMAISYATKFENKVSVGISVRLIFESAADIRSSGVALDGGVQYVNGPKDNFKLGLSLRNLGTGMKFSGQGLTRIRSNEVDGVIVNLAYDQRAAKFELPVALNIGTSYDFYAADQIRLTPILNFTSNSFSKDQLGFGGEIGILEEKLQVRAAYKLDMQTNVDSVVDDIYSGLALGASVNLPLGKESNTKIGVDYSYRNSNVFDGTHNFGVRINL